MQRVQVNGRGDSLGKNSGRGLAPNGQMQQAHSPKLGVPAGVSKVEVKAATPDSIKRAQLRCTHGNDKSHGLKVTKERKYPNLIGDAHLVNCNKCGAYFPKSGAICLRAAKR